MKIRLLFAIISGSISAITYAMDPGGTSLDLNSFKLLKENSAEDSPNLFRDSGFEKPDLRFKEGSGVGGWFGRSHLHGTLELRSLVCAEMTRKQIKGDSASGQCYAEILNPADLTKKYGKIPLHSNYIYQTIKLVPKTENRKFILSFKSRGRHFQESGSEKYAIVWADLKIPAEKIPEKQKRITQISHKLTLTPDWTDNSMEFIIPPFTEQISIRFRLYGPGVMNIDDTEFREVRPAPLQVRLIPATWLDNIYCIGENLPGIMNFVFKAEGTLNRKDLQLVLKLPPGFELVDTRDVTPLKSAETQPDGSTVSRISLQKLTPTAFTRPFYQLQSASVMVRSTYPASERLYSAEYYLEDPPLNFKSSPQNFELKILTASAGKRPEKFICGANIGHEFTFTGSGAQAAVDFYAQSGFNAVQGAKPPFTYAVRDQLKLPRYRELSDLSNGFIVGRTDIPENAQFRTLDGKHFNFGTCPVEIYQQCTYFKGKVIPMLENQLVKEDLTDHLMPNWEPFMFDDKGCFCERCRDEFIRWGAGNPSAEKIRQLWPDGIPRDADIKKRWIKFRSWQHGRIVVTLEQAINQIGRRTGKESHFIPECSARSARNNAYCEQYNILDYMNEIPFLNLWGPYMCHDLSILNSHYPAPHLVCWFSASQCNTFMRQHSRNPNGTTKLIALPQGFQGSIHITEPEAVAFETLIYFVQGWSGAFPYYFPRGYDYRWWREMARANTLVADHEKFIFEGKPFDTVEVIPMTPVPEHIYFPPVFDEGSRANLIRLNSDFHQYRAYRLGDALMVAVGNFWKKGEIFFTLKVKGLPDNSRYVVSTPSYGLGRFKGHELADGILMQVGGLRWQFITIDHNGKPPAEIYTQAEVRKLMAERLPIIEKAVAWENEACAVYQTANRDAVIDYTAIKPLTGGKVSLTPRDDGLLLQSSSYSLVLRPEKGGAITDLVISCNKICEGNDSWFGKVGFWLPRSSTVIESGFDLDAIKAVDHGISIELSRTLNRNDNAMLAGTSLKRRYTFTDKSVNLETTVENNSDDAMVFSFRYQHTLSPFLVDEGKSGEIVFADNVRYQRDFRIRQYRTGAADPEQMAVAKYIIDGGEIKPMDFRLFARDGRLLMNGTLDRLLYAVVFWDSGKMALPTMELIYQRRNLAPREKTTYNHNIVL